MLGLMFFFALVHIVLSITQHPLYKYGETMGHRSNGFWRTKTRAKAAVCCAKVTVTSV